MAKFKTNPFVFHGLILDTEIDGQLVGECPFCQKADHYYANPNDHLWDCKSCQAHGNLYTFLKQFHALAVESTTDADLSLIEQDRGIPIEALRRFGVCANPLNLSILLPTWNIEKTLTNLHSWTAKSGIYGTPSCATGLFNVQTLANVDSRPPAARSGPIYICEGHWDTIAVSAALRATGGDKTSDVIGVPGAGVFKSDWPHFLRGRNVVLLYDNDEAGRKGIARVVKVVGKFPHKPKTLKALNWSAGAASGYDIGDLYKVVRAKPQQLFQIIEANISTPEKPDGGSSGSSTGISEENADEKFPVLPLPCKTFAKLAKAFRETLYMTQSMEDTLAVMLAVNLSIYIRKNPLWIYVIGPPASGKTTLAEAIGVGPYTKAVSKLTGLMSGYIDETEEDSSIINLINHRCMVIKDFTATLSMPATTRENLYGEMRDCFDGSASVFYRNNVSRIYNDINFTVIACVTDEIRAHNTAALGERFLQVELLDDDHDPHQHVSIAIENALERYSSAFASDNGQVGESVEETPPDPAHHRLKQLSLGFLDHFHLMLQGKELKQPRFPQKYQSQINSLSDFIAKVRAKVNRGTNYDLSYRPRAEMGTRVADQLHKLGILLAIIFDKSEIDDEVYRIIRKVGQDTAYGFQFDIIRALIGKADEGLTSKQLFYTTGLPETTVKRRLADMLHLKLVQQGSRQTSTGQGRYAHVWRLSNDLEQLTIDTGMIQPNIKRKPRKRKRSTQ